MSNTPRTDAFAEQMFTKHDPLIAYKSAGVAEINDWENFARTLELDLAAAQANAEHWKVMYECAQNANAYRQAAIDAAIKEQK